MPLWDPDPDPLYNPPAVRLYDMYKSKLQKDKFFDAADKCLSDRRGKKREGKRI